MEASLGSTVIVLASRMSALTIIRHWTSLKTRLGYSPNCVAPTMSFWNYNINYPYTYTSTVSATYKGVSVPVSMVPSYDGSCFTAHINLDTILASKKNVESTGPGTTPSINEQTLRNLQTLLDDLESKCQTNVTATSAGHVLARIVAFDADAIDRLVPSCDANTAWQALFAWSDVSRRLSAFLERIEAVFGALANIRATTSIIRNATEEVLLATIRHLNCLTLAVFQHVSSATDMPLDVISTHRKEVPLEVSRMKALRAQCDAALQLVPSECKPAGGNGSVPDKQNASVVPSPSIGVPGSVTVSEKPKLPASAATASFIGCEFLQHRSRYRRVTSANATIVSAPEEQSKNDRLKITDLHIVNVTGLYSVPHDVTTWVNARDFADFAQQLYKMGDTTTVRYILLFVCRIFHICGSGLVNDCY